MKLEVIKNDLLCGVSDIVRLGMAVIPLRRGSNKPMTSGSPFFRRYYLEFAHQYFANHRGLNYGILTGLGIVVLNVDRTEGIVNLKILEASHIKLPRTLKVKTPYGEDYYFRKGDAVVPTSVGKIAAGMDVRGDGGYVVGPGSRTADGAYAFAEGCGPEDVPIAAAPDWLLALVKTGSSPSFKSDERSSEPTLTNARSVLCKLIKIRAQITPVS
jgi:putative DNA primase/helicase